MSVVLINTSHNAKHTQARCEIPQTCGKI